MRKSTSESEGPSARQRPSSGPSRGPTEGVLSELLKRLVETGAKNLTAESMRQLLSDVKLPGDALFHVLSQHLLVQLEETKQNVYRLVSRELKGLMERTNMADELASALTKLSLDVTMQVRFSPRSSETGPVRVKLSARDADTPADSAAPANSERTGSAERVIFERGTAGAAAERAASERAAAERTGERAASERTSSDRWAVEDTRSGSDHRAGTEYRGNREK